MVMYNANGKQLPAFPLEPIRGSIPGLRGGRRECYHSATVAPCSQIKNNHMSSLRKKDFGINSIHIIHANLVQNELLKKRLTYFLNCSKILFNITWVK